MVEALMELKAFRSLGDALWFSISARHLVRDPTATDEGRYSGIVLLFHLATWKQLLPKFPQS